MTKTDFSRAQEILYETSGDIWAIVSIVAAVREEGRQAGIRECIQEAREWMWVVEFPLCYIIEAFEEALNSPPPAPTSPPAAPSPPNSK